MAYAFEFMISLDSTMNRRKEILKQFEICKSFQMPVVEDEYLIGIVDLFDIINAPTERINIKSLLRTDFYVAGKQEGVFSFRLSNQDILPFVGPDEKYMGFSNRITIKCYVPGKEYLRAVEIGLPDSVYSEDGGNITEADLEVIEESFDAVVEDNYEGVYVTTDIGRTFAINNRATFLRNINNVSQLEVGINDLKKFQPPKIHLQEPTSTIQIMQERHEVSLMRITRNMFDLPRMEQEIYDMQELAAKYKQQLDAISIERNISEAFVCNSPRMKDIMKLVAQVAKVDSTILLEGDSGVGKGLMSRTIHEHSLRKDGPFTTIDCATLPPNLLESELFGYEKGAFTGAEKAGKIGLVELANNGTLFLDEVGELPLSLQAKLLRMLQERIIYKVGGKKAIPIDVRIIAATNRNLGEMVEEKMFRNDLYYRLRVIPITIPPLSQRKEDVRPLIDFYIGKYNNQYKLNKCLSAGAYRALLHYNWPGNVRELQHTIEFLVITSSSDLIRVDELPDDIQASTPMPANSIDFYSDCTLKAAQDRLEKKLLLSTMEKCNSTLEMAELLGTDRSTITRKLQKHKILKTFREG